MHTVENSGEGELKFFQKSLAVAMLFGQNLKRPGTLLKSFLKISLGGPLSYPPRPKCAPMDVHMANGRC